MDAAALAGGGFRSFQGGRMNWVLRAAAIYNVLWGAFVILFPDALFDWAAIERPNYPQIWQCVGMIVGVYGLGYWWAARDPERYWPVVATGLAGKILGPLGFVYSAVNGSLPWKFGWTILTNDLIWWIPFGLILWRARRAHASEEEAAEPTPEEMDRWLTSRGESLSSLSRKSPVLLVFLRHAGCTFCREAMADLARQRKRIEKAGVRIVLAHMSPRGQFRAFAARYGLEDLDHIADPTREMYQAFGLKRGSFGQLFGWEVWKRGFQAGLRDGHGIGKPEGDPAQMPGAFLLWHGCVVRSHRHVLASDRANYFIFCALPFLNEAGDGELQSANLG